MPHGENGIKELSEEALELVAERFKALSEPARLRLLRALMEGEKTVSGLVAETGLLQANVSKHLGVLLDSGVVGRRKQGTSSYYRIVDETVRELCDLVCGSIQERLSAELEAFSAVNRSPSRDDASVLAGDRPARDRTGG